MASDSGEHILSVGEPAVNTVERLEQTAGSRMLSGSGSANLLDAFEFIGKLRIEYQRASSYTGSLMMRRLLACHWTKLYLNYWEH